QHFMPDGTVPWDWAQVPITPYHLGVSPRICSDANGGAFVGLDGEGVQHVLATGQIDPRWPPDALFLSNAQQFGDDEGVCPDGAGGVYVAWSESRTKPWLQCMVQRITDSATVAPGWPTGGRMLSEASCLAGGFRTDGFISYRDMSIV